MLHIRKSLINGSNGGIRIEVPRENYCHIVRHIIGIEVLAYLYQGWIFEVFHGTYGCLLAIVMLLKEIGQECFQYQASIVIQRTVLFLIYSLQFGMEDTQYRIAEALGLYSYIFVQGIGGHIISIDGLLERGEGVGALGSHGGHHLVILVGDRILASNTRYSVYFLIDFFTLLGVFGFVILFVEGIYFIELYFFLCPV